MTASRFTVLNTEDPNEADAVVLGMNFRAVKADVLRWWDTNIQVGGDKRSFKRERGVTHAAKLLGITGQTVSRWKREVKERQVL